MIAIVSDTHANAPALEAVMADIEGRGINEIFSLGDVVGYGPFPIECLEIAKKFKINLLGNHEEGVLFDPKGFSQRARTAAEWTQKQLENLQKQGGEDLFAMIGTMRKRHVDGSVMYVHGSPRDPTQEYIFPGDTHNPDKLQSIFNQVKKACFVGHTHYAGIFTEEGEFITPRELSNIYMTDDGNKTIVNVGSVGQPRDGNPMACYATFDGDTVVFHRVKYNIQKTADKIFDTPGLDNSLGTRLLKGK